MLEDLNFISKTKEIIDLLRLLTGRSLTNNERGRCGDNSGSKGEYDRETHDDWVETEGGSKIQIQS